PLVNAFESVAPAKAPARKKNQTVKTQPTRRPETSEGEPKEKKRAHWPIVIWLALVHLGALAAFWTFSWEGVILLVALHWLTGGIGICLGYHRLLTHGSFQTYKPVKWIIAAIGGLAGEGAAVDWVANHRKHHALSDQEGDPHSPRDGAWWSHVFWLAFTQQGEEHKRHVQRWAPDLAKDKVLNWIGLMFLP